MVFFNVPDSNGLASKNKGFTSMYKCTHRINEKEENHNFPKMGIYLQMTLRSLVPT